LTNWEGDGFVVRSGCFTSEEAERHPALLHRRFIIPGNAAVIEFRAASVRPDGLRPTGALDVVLEVAGGGLLPKMVLEGSKWVPTPSIFPGPERSYLWQVHEHTHRPARITLVDRDSRPGCHLVCSPFTIVTRDELNARHFEADLRAVDASHGLYKCVRHDSDHFMVLSNSEQSFTQERIENCETLYTAFFEHFQARGFTLTEPTDKLMVAVLRTQRAFEAFLDLRLGPAVSGVYHTPTNRLVIYDYATNSSFLEARSEAEKTVKKAKSDRERQARATKLEGALSARRENVNVTTVMHEVAHQLAYNSGLLNREGDAPAWLVEGMAMYCEPCEGGKWKGIGATNPMRRTELASGKGKVLTLRQLIRDDDWLRKANYVQDISLGYSQSWALFRMLMEQRPQQLRDYLTLIYTRRTPDRRLTDFGEAFGSIEQLEARYADYLVDLAKP
jgi:hypothetical protein